LLSNAGVFDVVGHAFDGGENRVNGDRVDAVFGVVTLTWDVTHALFDADFHDQLATFANRADWLIQIHDFSIRWTLEVGGGHDFRTFDANREGLWSAAVEFHHEFFEVEDDVNHVFGHTRDGGELVQYVFDVHACDSRARDARE
jgi:hypothetical protein